MTSVENSISDRGKSHTLSELKGGFRESKGIEGIMDKGTDAFGAYVHKDNGNGETAASERTYRDIEKDVSQR